MSEYRLRDIYPLSPIPVLCSLHFVEASPFWSSGGAFLSRQRETAPKSPITRQKWVHEGLYNGFRQRRKLVWGRLGPNSQWL